MKKLFTLVLIAFTIAAPSKDDFNELFIQVSQKGSPSVVTVVSEKTENKFFIYILLLLFYNIIFKTSSKFIEKYIQIRRKKCDQY